MLHRALESTIYDSELLGIVETMRVEMPEVVQSIVSGRLRSMGLHVSRERIRRCIQISDPLNTVWRCHKAPFHQPYSVPGPNSLWHIGMFSSVFMYIMHMC